MKFMNNLFKNKYFRFIMVLILVFTMCFAIFTVQANAVAVVDDAVILVVASVLLASGIIFATTSEANQVSTDFYNSSDTYTKAWFDQRAQDVRDGNADLTAIPIVQEVVDSVANWIGNLYNAVTCTIDISGGNGTFLGPLDIGSYIYPTLQTSWTVPNSYPASNYLPITSTSSLLNYVFSFQNGSITQARFLLTDGVVSLQVSSDSGPFYNNSGFVGNIGLFLFPVSWMPDSYLVSVLNYDSGERFTGYMLKTALNTSAISTSLAVDTTFFPNEVIDSAPTTTFPSNTATQPLTTSIPLSVPASLENLIDGGLEGVRGEITNTNTILGNIASAFSTFWEWVQSLPTAIATAITSVFIPTDFSFTNWLGSIFEPVCPTFNFNDYVNELAIPDITANYRGSTMTFVDNSNLRDNIADFRKYIQAFMTFLLILYNLNMFMRLLGYHGFSITDNGKSVTLNSDGTYTMKDKG